MKLSEYDYDLPPELIAQRPIENRDDSRLLFYVDERIEHKKFKDIIGFLNDGDTLVLNNSKVIPARIFGNKKSGGKIELLLLKQLNELQWKTLIKAKNMKVDSEIVFDEGYSCKIIKKEYEVIIEFNKPINDYIKEHGEMPIPPYIKERLEEQGRYQTVYAEHEGSAAAPTAGLHFTDYVFEELKKKGVNIVYVTLHVGLGTFLPVKTENVLEHKMHSEYFEISKETADVINNTKGKVVAVGTTSIRSLEAASDNGIVKPAAMDTEIFIYPGYEFKSPVTHLITNFHLPKSTLLMLISAFKGYEEIKKAYTEAIKEKYRFFSLGDAMILNKKN